jgi:aerobic-type carbon monoxide dehydrogenase small subunit (CoxS/CutS family)
VAYAAEEKTIKGDTGCAKCTLKETKECQNVLTVDENGKEVNYYMDMKNKVAKENHQKGGFCQGGKVAKVTGTIKEEGGKKWIEPTKIEVVEN